MPTLDEIKEDIKRHENAPLLEGKSGFTPTQVKRSDGTVEQFLTGGYGHILTAAESKLYKGKKVPQDVIDKWFDIDFAKAHKSAESQAKHIKAPSLVGALSSVNFQLGTSWNKKFKNTWKDMEQGRWKSAAVGALSGSKPNTQSAWFKQTPTRAKAFSNALIQKGTVPAGNLTPVKKP